MEREGDRKEEGRQLKSRWDWYKAENIGASLRRLCCL